MYLIKFDEINIVVLFFGVKCVVDFIDGGFESLHGEVSMLVCGNTVCIDLPGRVCSLDKCHIILFYRLVSSDGSVLTEIMTGKDRHQATLCRCHVF